MRSAIAAERSAKAAEETVAVYRLFAQSGQRPWLVPQDAMAIEN